MRVFLGGAMAVGLATSALAEICGPGATVDYPLSEVLHLEASGYVTTAIMNTDVETLDPAALAAYWPAYLDALKAREAELPGALADLPYLIALGEALEYPDPFFALTYMAQSAALPRIVQALERQGLRSEAEMVRLPMAAFPDWDAGPDARYEQSDGQVSGLRQMSMELAVKALQTASPRIEAATEALIASDAGVAADYAARREATDADTRLNYLAYRLIVECLPDWWTETEADAAFAVMAEPQRDVLLLHFFLMESFNGSTHQYFFNSSGTMAPQLAEALDRAGLPDHAAGIRQGMAVFPGDYPRDTDARRAIMSEFNEAQDDALYALTVFAEDGKILEAMAQLAEAAGLMPR